MDDTYADSGIIPDQVVDSAMALSNARGQYGTRPIVGAEARPFELPHSPTILPWVLGGVGLMAVGLTLLGMHASKRPRLSAHEKEVRAWEAEFPGLPWLMDQVKDSRQMDMWERARDHWERSH